MPGNSLDIQIAFTLNQVGPHLGMGLYKRSSQSPDSPWGLCAYISGDQPSWVYLGFWQDREWHVTLFQAVRITDLVPDLIQNLCNIRRLRYKARINSGITGLGLNASCSARFPFTGLVFNWL